MKTSTDRRVSAASCCPRITRSIDPPSNKISHSISPAPSESMAAGLEFHHSMDPTSPPSKSTRAAAGSSFSFPSARRGRSPSSSKSFSGSIGKRLLQHIMMDKTVLLHLRRTSKGTSSIKYILLQVEHPHPNNGCVWSAQERAWRPISSQRVYFEGAFQVREGWLCSFPRVRCTISVRLWGRRLRMRVSLGRM